MTDPNEKCPTQFRTYSENGVRACGRPVTNSGRDSCGVSERFKPYKQWSCSVRADLIGEY